MEENEVKLENEETQEIEKPNAKQSKKIIKKWWFWLILGALVVGVVVAVTVPTVKASKKRTYGLNDTVLVRDLEYKITDIYDSKHIGNEHLGANTEQNFVVVTFEIKNDAKKEKTIMSENFEYFRGENKYSASTEGIKLGDNGFYILLDIEPTVTNTIQVVYEIPSSHEENDYILVRDRNTKEKIYLK